MQPTIHFRRTSEERPDIKSRAAIVADRDRTPDEQRWDAVLAEYLRTPPGSPRAVQMLNTLRSLPLA